MAPAHSDTRFANLVTLVLVTIFGDFLSSGYREALLATVDGRRTVFPANPKQGTQPTLFLSALISLRATNAWITCSRFMTWSFHIAVRVRFRCTKLSARANQLRGHAFSDYGKDLFMLGWQAPPPCGTLPQRRVDDFHASSRDSWISLSTSTSPTRRNVSSRMRAARA
jgi:hypothetical protein